MPETRGVPLEEMERNLGIELSEEDISGRGSGAAGALSRERRSLRRTVDAHRRPPARRVPPVTIADRSRVDLREVLRTTCAASPVEAIDVMADGLGHPDRGHVRPVPDHERHAPGRRALRRIGRERGPGAAGERRHRGPPPARHGLRAGAAPPADRADRRGRRRAHPRAGHGERRRPRRDRPAPAARGRRAASSPTSPPSPRRWPGSSIASRRHSDLMDWAQDTVAVLAGRGDPAAAAARAPTRARPTGSPSPAGWSRRTPSAATRSTTPSTATPCTCR